MPPRGDRPARPAGQEETRSGRGRRSRLLPATIAAAVVSGFAVWSIAVSWDVGSGSDLLDGIIRSWGLLILALGVTVWLRSPHPGLGQLVVLTAGLYHLNFLRGSTDPVVFGVGFCLTYAWVAAINHVIVTWPDGRARSRLQQSLVAFAYVTFVGTQVLRYVVDRPEAPMAFGRDAPVTPLTQLGTLMLLVVIALVLGYHIGRWLRGTVADRLHTRGLRGPMLVWFALSVVLAVVSLRQEWWREQGALFGAVLVIGLMSVGVVGIAQRERWFTVTGRVARVVLDLGRDPARLVSPTDVQQAIGRAVGDPTLLLLFPVGRQDQSGLVGIDGAAAAAEPDRATGRVRTPVDRDGRRIAVIEHDQVLGQDVVETAGLAAALSLERVQLNALLRAQVQQLTDSRLRIASTAADERARIRRDLHDGAQQELYATLLLLDRSRQALAATDPSGEDTQQAATLTDRAHDRVTAAIAGLRRLVDGLVASALLERGLAVEIADLVDLAPIDVDLDVAVDRRHEPEAELAAYFVVAEALANVYKHADATRVTITLRSDGASLSVAVVDDGNGRIDDAGPGLTALGARVRAARGTLRLARHDGQGSSVHAVFAGPD